MSKKATKESLIKPRLSTKTTCNTRRGMREHGTHKRLYHKAAPDQGNSTKGKAAGRSLAKMFQNG